MQLPSFEELRKLAETDPDALEILRQQHVSHAINAAPEEYRQRLEGLQFQIDGQRRLSKSPMAACLNISKMMHDSLHGMKDYIEGVQGEKDIINESFEPATVLSFSKEQPEPA